jgi:hypothetical protein
LQYTLWQRTSLNLTVHYFSCLLVPKQAVRAGG